MIDGKNTMLAMSELHQQQFLAHYVGATDTKGHALSPDEKLVSWLLERQFSRDAQNLPRKTNPKNDFNSEDSDTETSGKKDVASEAQGYIIPQKTSNLEDVFRQLTMKLAEIRDNGVVNTKEEIFEVLESWRFGRDQDAETQRMEREVLLFGKLIKQGDIRFNNAKITQDPVIIKAMNEHEHNILKAEPLTESEAEEIQNIFTLPKQRRWQLYAYWRQNLIRRTRALLPDIMTTYKKCCDAIKDYRLLEDANILRKSLVIGATTTGAAKNRKLLEMLKCRSVIVEEAAEVLEAHVLSTFLPSVEHVVLIGDHEQLRPNPSVYMLARDYGLDCSLFERLCKNKFPLTTLEVQHRMREEITKIIVRPHFYKNLLDHDDIKQYPAVKGLDKNLFFWTHKFEEVNLGTDSVSHRNDYEIVQAVELTRYLLKQGAYEKNEITVLCTYAAQTTAMREAISQLGTTIDGRTEVPVETVDGFQGKENRVIILSLVRSISESNTVGFLGVKNRICVSWTRAQHGLYVLGNMEFLATKSCLWQELATSLTTEGMVDYYLPIRCSTHGRLQKIGCPDEFTKKSPEGGCDMDCLSSLPCSHKCPRKCHPIDDHEIWKCETLVLKTCARKVHQAEKLCCEQYGPCSRMVDISLPCNHITQIACFMNDSEARCSHRCEQSLPCEHQCAKRCSEPCDVICNQLVPMPFSECPYGHTTKIPCQEVARFLERMVPCDQPCTEILVCGHKCSNKCGDDCTFECQMKLKRKKKCGHDVEMMCYEDPDIVKCQELVLRKLNGCGHESMVPCFAGKSQKYCTKVCLKTLECGLGNSKHTCTRKCGECYEGGHMCTSTCEKTFTCGHLCLARCGVACPPCEQPCYTQCEHQICGRPKGPEDHRIGFDRTCPGLCALCIKACSNSCVHRACSKKCFEICDVSACNEHCTKALKCGHPCLGFCGEACPDLCFSCGRQQYDYLIKTFVSSDLATETALSQFVKLSCSHIFPASFLDTHVKGCREKKTIVTCPLKNCRLPIQLSQRYSGACKRAIIAREKEKAVRLGQASVLLSVTDQTQPQDATRSLLIRIAKIAQDLKSSQPGKKNTTITIHDRFTALLRLANKFEQCLRVKSLVQDIDYGGAENYLEWHNSLRLLECLVQLHRNLQFNQQKKLKKIPQARLCWLNQMFTLLQNDVSSVEDALSSHICELANVVEDNLGSRLPGTYIPLVLFEIHKLAFNVTFLMLFRCISGAIDKVVDITKDQCKEIEKLARKFQSTDRHNERHLLFGILMALLNREVLLPQKKALSGFQMPDFIFPKF
ncbi:unnamed protein product, partial [Mesorhabditis belari]|uniref:NF-X1-type domain-containing protein n=1 Tax=Mesorhabditis belari TaxID=2138241 RepID=A0AAF3F7E2_9BILA